MHVSWIYDLPGWWSTYIPGRSFVSSGALLHHTLPSLDLQYPWRSLGKSECAEVGKIEEVGAGEELGDMSRLSQRVETPPSTSLLKKAISSG